MIERCELCKPNFSCQNTPDNNNRVFIIDGYVGKLIEPGINPIKGCPRRIEISERKKG